MVSRIILAATLTSFLAGCGVDGPPVPPEPEPEPAAARGISLRGTAEIGVAGGG